MTTHHYGFYKQEAVLFYQMSLKSTNNKKIGGSRILQLNSNIKCLLITLVPLLSFPNPIYSNSLCCRFPIPVSIRAHKYVILILKVHLLLDLLKFQS